MSNVFDSLTIDFAKLDAQRKVLRKGLLEAERDTIKEVGREAEKALEAATSRAGLGKLAKAWNSRLYPRGKLANDPVALIYPKGGDRTRGAIRTHSQGATIRSRGGGMIAIPLPAAALSARDRRPTPEQWELATGIKLVPVERPGKPTLLVAQGVRVLKSGRVKGASDSAIRRGRFASAPIFVLMPVLREDGRFSVEATVRPFRTRLRDEFLRRANRIV